MTLSLLYKYRGLDPWEFLLDILVNQRLYAAPYQSLNDPMEGAFTYSHDNVSPSFIEQMINHKGQLGICSLSRSHNNTVMWSYYAAAHKGVVIGVSIEKTGQNIVEINDVSYVAENVFTGFYGSDVHSEARKILSKKLTAWRHEAEVRVFSNSNFVPVTLVSVHLGYHMPESQKTLLRQLIKCINPAVKIEEMKREDLDSRFDGVRI
jgi:hypothetical protein